MDSDPQRGHGREDNALAYGEYHEPTRGEHQDGGSEGGEGERGLIGDTYGKIRSKYGPQSGDGASSSDGPQASSGLGSLVFEKLHGVVHEIGSEITQRLGGHEEKNSHTHVGAQCDDGMHRTQFRYSSFAPQRTGSHVKWHVDGCAYMWAVSRALEQASQSIWILDWWLSPELYLRRPPSRNEQYRVDRMLQAAAQRGVKVNIIVYKEVTQALTRKFLSPTLPKYLHSLLPNHTNAVTKAIAGLGLAATFASLEHAEKKNPLIEPPLTVSSSHTKHALENLHPNIAVFRHPDHLPDVQTLQSSFISSLQNISLTAKKASSLPTDTLKAIYGMNEDIILYWAHHEKLCIVDDKTAFMGGLDLCYGRWDTNQHSIADCHPSNLDDIVFPGQDYNNARIMDFQDVAHWQNNKLDRKDSSRMGWSDVSISLNGPVVEDLRAHFVERWNYIYDEKYNVRKDARYSRLAISQDAAGVISSQSSQAPQQSYQAYKPQLSQESQPPLESQDYGSYPPPPPRPQSGEYPPSPSGPSGSSPYPNQAPYYPPPPTNRELGDGTEIESDSRAISSESRSANSYHHRLQTVQDEAMSFGENVRGRFEDTSRHFRDQYLGGHHRQNQQYGGSPNAGIPCQLVRSCTKWSHGIPTEHSIANAYISVIENSQHFVYIENQFFITATSDKQKPVKNKIGAAIVDRILRAARAGEKYKIIVVIPAIPAFAGDLREDSSLGTRAIMEFQYNSINRGGYSIMERIANAGYDPTQYIRFYNLRNYDRINTSGSMQAIERASGVDYSAASYEHDRAVELPVESPGTARSNYQQYQRFTSQTVPSTQPTANDHWDTVSSSYMLNGQPLPSIPWTPNPNPTYTELDAFVSEELYVHSKVLIADDRIVIVGSANLNDRSQLGSHDSEIALVIQDPTSLPSYMNTRPFTASKFAGTLRRFLFRKHLGLIPAQDMSTPDRNFEPVNTQSDNSYDYNSAEDKLVADPLSDAFLNLWNEIAKGNTDAFAQVFHPVPHDGVRNWKDYERYYEHFFKGADKAADASKEEKKEEEAEGKEGSDHEGSSLMGERKVRPSKYMWGHVVAEEFPPGEAGVQAVKDVLGRVRGTLVEMPLLFLIEEDIAKEGVALNAFTEEVYT